MRLARQAHLAYCTNIHPGNDWAETFRSLDNEVRAVRAAVAPDEPYAIGLRLSERAARELVDRARLADFRRWLEREDCYVFTINGFPYGNFHGERVKEQVYRPDWTQAARLDYTVLLFQILAELLPSGEPGSVSTLPGSFKRFVETGAQREAIFANLYACFERIDALSASSGHDLHLGLEPEPLGLFETSAETVAFFEDFTRRRPERADLLRRIGVNYDACHLAVEHERAADALGRLSGAGIRISKLHLSAALKLDRPGDPRALAQLDAFADDIYLHQVIARETDGSLTRYEDLAPALDARRSGRDRSEEWRVHFHIPLHTEPQAPLRSTRDHLLETLDALAADPGLCQHLEMETYTWAVLPAALRSASVVEQLAKEYQWLLPELERRNLR